jgi:hypothetical protein
MTTVATVTADPQLQIVGVTSVCQMQRRVHTDSSLTRVPKTALHPETTQHFYVVQCCVFEKTIKFKRFVEKIGPLLQAKRKGEGF